MATVTEIKNTTTTTPRKRKAIVAPPVLPPVRLTFSEYFLVLLSARDKRIETRAVKRAARRKERDAKIIALLGPAKKGVFHGRVITAVSSSNSSINQKLLAEINPEAYTLTRVVTPYTYLKLSK